jgi:hypothetical protein
MGIVFPVVGVPSSICETAAGNLVNNVNTTGKPNEIKN